MKEKFSEMTDSQWQVVEKIIDNQRARHHSLRTIVNAIFWINNTGSQWRNMESKYPPWQTVYWMASPVSFSTVQAARYLGGIAGLPCH